jgi:hypothetical protein
MPATRSWVSWFVLIVVLDSFVDEVDRTSKAQKPDSVSDNARTISKAGTPQIHYTESPWKPDTPRARLQCPDVPEAARSPEGVLLLLVVVDQTVQRAESHREYGIDLRGHYAAIR